MGVSPNGRYQGARATQAHYARLPIRIQSEIPLADEDRSTPPEIGSDVAWFVITTAPRGEIAAARALREIGYVAYAPAETKWIAHSARSPRIKREVQRAIFARYVFLGMRPGQSWHLLRERDAFGRNRHGVAGVLTAEGRPARIPVDPVRALAAEEREGWFDERRKPELLKARMPELAKPAVMAGESLRIAAGPFLGHEGTADADVGANGRLRASVAIFGRATLVEVSIDDVENLTRPQPRIARELQRA